MSTATAPRDLTAAYVTDPVGIGEQFPTLRWAADAQGRGAEQTAFRVLVASTPERLAAGDGDVWDTGKRRSSRAAVEYDGQPLDSGTTYHWKVRVWDAEDRSSAWSDRATFETGLFEADDWSASWIRRPGEAERGQFSYFRREFALDGTVERARAYISASHQYELSLNGESVDRGQAFSYPDFQYYKTVDLDDYLTDGENAVGVVHNWNDHGQGRPAAEPGLLVQFEVEFADGRERVLTTGGDWRVREGPWLDTDLRNGEIAEPIEVIDAREDPEGWTEPGFDDGEWDRAAVAGEHPTDPWERVIAQQRELTRHSVSPESVERLDDDTYVFDFGRVYTGVPVIEFDDGEAGHRVDLLPGYRRKEDGSVDDTEGTQWTRMEYGYVQEAGPQRFRPFNYLGFRYLQVDDPGEELDPEQVSILASHNEVPDRHAGTFESSEPTVDDVFELARHSALYGSQEQFIDTPTREKGQFLMDGLNISRTAMGAFGERRLTRAAISEFVRSHYRYWAPEGRLNAVYPNGDGKRDIPDFTAMFPDWVYRYYETADDPQVLEETYPVVRAVADYVIDHVDPGTGLVHRLSGGEGGPYHEGIVDWPPEMRYGYDRDWPARTTVNVTCAHALERAAQIAEALDRPDAELSYYREHRETIVEAVDEHLREGDRYVDGGDGAETSDHVSQHANALPLATGIVPDEHESAVADRVASEGIKMGPMMVPWLLEALDAADRPAAMVDLLTDREADGWANILDVGGTFTWETWHCRTLADDDERHNRSESHAMGATVLEYVQRTLLGVNITARGGSEVAIEPPRTGLDHAEGTVPTEHGTVAVSWERTGDGLALSATVPWNTTATVTLPTDNADAATVTEDGETIGEDLPEGVESVTRTDEGVVLTVGAGEYAFEASS